jgi:hypothetical protein
VPPFGRGEKVAGCKGPRRLHPGAGSWRTGPLLSRARLDPEEALDGGQNRREPRGHFPPAGREGTEESRPTVLRVRRGFYLVSLVACEAKGGGAGGGRCGTALRFARKTKRREEGALGKRDPATI